MGRLGLAFRLFFRVLKDAAFAERQRRLLQLPAPDAAAPTAAATTPAVRAAAARSEAVTLLAVLQREARLIDFLKEDISPYADAQVGAAVRDVHRDASAVLERLFALRPVFKDPEGAEVQVSGGVDASRVRLTGNVTGQPPVRGALRHAGWEATQLVLPEWMGSASSARVVAPAEVEVK